MPPIVRSVPFDNVLLLSFNRSCFIIFSSPTMPYEDPFALLPDHILVNIWDQLPANDQLGLTLASLEVRDRTSQDPERWTLKFKVRSQGHPAERPFYLNAALKFSLEDDFFEKALDCVFRRNFPGPKKRFWSKLVGILICSSEKEGDLLADYVRSRPQLNHCNVIRSKSGFFSSEEREGIRLAANTHLIVTTEPNTNLPQASVVVVLQPASPELILASLRLGAPEFYAIYPLVWEKPNLFLNCSILRDLDMTNCPRDAAPFRPKLRVRFPH